MSLPRLLVGVAAGAEIHLRGIGHRQVFRIEAGIDDGRTQIVAVHAGEQVGVDDVVGAAFGDHALVAFRRIGFLCGDEGGADIGKVGADGARRQNAAAGGDGAGKRDRSVEPGADLLDQREGRQRAGMAAGAGCDGNETVRTFLDRLACEAVGDHVVQRYAAIGMHRVVQVLARAQRGDHYGRLVFHAECQVLLEPVVRPVHDLVDGEGRRRAFRMGAVMGREFFGDTRQPFVQQRDRPRIERREGADDAGFALGDDEIRIGNDEKRRGDHRDRQRLRKCAGQLARGGFGNEGHGRLRFVMG